MHLHLRRRRQRSPMRQQQRAVAERQPRDRQSGAGRPRQTPDAAAQHRKRGDPDRWSAADAASAGLAAVWAIPSSAGAGTFSAGRRCRSAAATPDAAAAGMAGAASSLLGNARRHAEIDRPDQADGRIDIPGAGQTKAGQAVVELQRRALAAVRLQLPSDPSGPWRAFRQDRGFEPPPAGATGGDHPSQQIGRIVVRRQVRPGLLHRSAGAGSSGRTGAGSRPAFRPCEDRRGERHPPSRPCAAAR